MNELDEIYNVLNIIKNNKVDIKSPIPIFSFEGLPGSGKTTQINLVSNKVNLNYGKSTYIDLPTNSPIGEILSILYSDINKWNKIRSLNPWINPLLLSVDLRLNIKNAILNNIKYIFMSRGILSTYYYNLDAYLEENNWEQLTNHLRAFYIPSAIIFLEVPESIAYERVVTRNRGILRKMDMLEQMKTDNILLHNYLNKLSINIPIYCVDAVGDKDTISERIIEKLIKHLK